MKSSSTSKFIFALIASISFAQSAFLDSAKAETLPPGPYKCNTRDFKKAAVTALKRAQQNGWTGVGDLPLEEAKQEIKQSRAQVDCDDKKLNITDGRWSGRYDSIKKTVQVRRDNFKPAPEGVQEAFALHELVQVEGHRDLNYDFSLRVQQMGKRKFDPKSPLNDMPKVLHKFPKGNAIKKSGGSTGVGGGGDVTDFHIRNMMVEAFLDAIERTQFKGDGRARAHEMVNLAMTVDIIFLVEPTNVMSEPRIVRVSYPTLKNDSSALGIVVGRGYMEYFRDKAIAGIFKELGNIMNIRHAELDAASGKTDAKPQLLGELKWTQDGTAAQAESESK